MKKWMTFVAVAVGLSIAGAAHAHEFTYGGTLNGGTVSPPAITAGTGTLLVTEDLDLITLRVEVTFSNLSSPVTSAHLHGVTALTNAGTAGIAVMDPSLPLFPLGVTAGTYDQTIDLTTGASYSPAFITASGGMVSDALNALIFGLQDGKIYFEIDTVAFPNGEVRGFPTLVPAPEPAAGLLAAAGACVLLRRRRRA